MIERWTPGPWRSQDEFTVVAEVGAVICNVLSFDDFPCVEQDDETVVNEEAKANARLIAAAPELYAGLADMLALFGRPHAEEYVDGGRSYRLACETTDRARTVLANARGETP